MNITLIRHAKVLYRYKLFYRYFEFDLACKAYDESDIGVPKSRLARYEGSRVFVSALRRTHDTAELIFSNPIQCVENEIFNEVPIRSFARLSFPLPTFIWIVGGRLQWYLGFGRQPETREETQKRASLAADILEQESQSSEVVLISHGFFMSVLVKELRSRGYKTKGLVRFRNLDRICLSKVSKVLPTKLS